MSCPIAQLQPSLSADNLYPVNAVFMTRSQASLIRHFGYDAFHADAVSGRLIGILKGRSTIRHRSVCHPLAWNLLEQAGIDVDEDLHVYETREEAESIADGLIEKGGQIIPFTPFAPNRFSDNAQLFPSSTYEYLYEKQHLPELVPTGFLPSRVLANASELEDWSPPGPVFLKAAKISATGAGNTVRYCADPTSFRQACQWFLSHLNDGKDLLLVAENKVEVLHSWCAGLAVSENWVHCFGAAQQLFAELARQSGSLISPDAPLPDDALPLLNEIGSKAQNMGFRGIAGVDLGMDAAGKLYVFDLNFRMCSSTVQILFHASAVNRCGVSCSLSFRARSRRRFAALIDAIKPAVEASWFTPTTIVSGDLHPASEGQHMIIGFIMGNNEADARKRADSICSIMGAV